MLLLTGYGNLPPELFLAAVREAYIDLALDCRLVPWGWHPLYRGSAFLAALREEGGAREARHAPGLGNAAKRDGGDMRLAEPAALERLLAVLDAGRRVLVICGCGRAERCHRSLVAQLVRERRLDLELAELDLPLRPRATAKDST